MTIDIKPIDPANRAFFAGEVSGLDLTSPLSTRRGRRRPCRHGPLRRAGVPRPEDRRRPAARLQPQPGAARAGDRRHRRSPGPAHEHGPERHLQPRQEQQGSGARRPPPPVRPRQPALALRQLVQAGAGQVFAPVGAQHPADRRQHRVRRHARGLRRARRGDQARGARPDLPAQPDLFPRHPGLHRLHRRGAREMGAGAPAPGAPPSRRPAGCRSISPAMPPAWLAR